MKTILLGAATAIVLFASPALADTPPAPTKTAAPTVQPAQAMLPITLTPEETAGVITLLGQMPAAQSGQLYNFFLAKEQAAQAAKK